MKTEHDNALDAAKIALIGRKDSVFISTVLFSLRFAWDDSIPTACTNGESLLINPEFFTKKMDKDERIFVLAHEAYHVAFQHMVRVNDRDFKLWNIATDYVINLMLHNAGFKVDRERFLLDEKYKDMDSYQVYDELKKQPPSKLPECPDDMEQVEGTPEQIKEIEERIVDTISKAAIRAKMSNQVGTIPGEIEIFLDKLLKPKLPWYKILANLLNGMNKEDYSFRKPNRRFMPDYYLPGLYSESLGEIAVAIDVSGSISQEEFNAFVSEVHSIHKSMKPDKTTVISFDTEITDEYSIEQEQDILGLKFTGGGGTEIRPVYEWTKERKPKALIIFTDGYFDLHQTEIPNGIPLFWIIHSNDNFKISKGKIIPYKD